MAKFKLRDKREKERFGIDDEYINGMAKHLDPHATAVYASLCRHANFNNQEAFPSQEQIAKQHNISARTVRSKIRLLQEFNIVQIKTVRDGKGRYKHNIYTLMDKSVWKHPEETDSYGHPEETDDTIHRKEIPPKVTNKKVTNIPPIESPLKKNKKQKIQQITKEDMEAIAEKYSVPLAFVMSKYDDLINYCERTGKKYKNYVAALRNFVKQDAIKLRKEAKGEPTKRAIDASNL